MSGNRNHRISVQSGRSVIDACLSCFTGNDKATLLDIKLGNSVTTLCVKCSKILINELQREIER